jgi:hypothetical protein
LCAANVRYWGVKRTCRFALQMSATSISAMAMSAFGGNAATALPIATV